MNAYGIELDSLELSPEALSDQTIGWLIQNADPELWAPRHYLIVDEKCKGDHHMIATWFAIYRLLIFYKPIGKRAFGQREIAAVGRVGRGHLSGKNGTIRKLAHLGLIIIDGYEGDEGDEGKPIFRIDTARLEAESILLTRKRLSAGQLVPRRKPAVHGQLDMFKKLGLTPDDEMLTLARHEHQAGDEYLKVPEPASIGAAVRSTSGSTAPMGATTAIEATSRHRQAPGVAPIGAAFREGRHPGAPDVAPMGATFEGSWHPGAPGVAPMGAAQVLDQAGWHLSVPHGGQDSADWLPPGPHTEREAAPPESTLAPVGALREIDHEIERRRERPAAAPGAASLTQDSLTLMIHQVIAQQLPALMAATLRQLGSNGLAGGGSVAAPPSPLLNDDVPPRPCPEEVELQRGLLTTWRTVSRQDKIPDRDIAQLEIMVSRYTPATKNHAAYWLCRAMWDADRRHHHGGEPVSISLINGYMQRMELEGFSTAVLENPPPKGSKKQGTTSEGIAPKSKGGAASAPPPALERAPALAHQGAAPVAGTLPPELAEHWVITTWRSYAGADAVILVDRAQHLIATVSRRDVWEAVLANWRDKYKSKANWTQFDGLLDWYSREAAKPVTVTADEFDPDGPPPSASVIDNHPDLGDTRADWYRRFHAAGDSKAAKQAVIRRLLAEHPIEPTN